MKKLRIILQSNIFSFFLLIIIVIYCFLILKNNIVYTNYNINSKYFVGTITNIKKENNLNVLYVVNKENIIVYDYSKKKLKIGDKIKVFGKFKKVESNNNFNLFNYKNYLLSKRINWIVESNYIEFLNSGNILYKIKNFIVSRLSKINNPYLNAFIIGDNSNIDSTIKQSYQINGISHLFALSGMHVSLIIIVINFIFKNVLKFKNCSLFLIGFLLLYLFLTDYSKSVIRASLLYIFIIFNKKMKLNLNIIQIIILILFFNLIMNPYNIYNNSFLFSYTATSAIVLCCEYINSLNNYLKKILITSLIAFISTIPILVNSYFQINLISIILNLFYIPFVSFIIFPLSLIVFCFPFFNSIFTFFIFVLENSSLFLSKINLFKITLCHINIFVFIMYYLVILFTLMKVKTGELKYIIIIFIVIILHVNFKYLKNDFELTMLNVDQGDCFLITLPHNKGNVLIDIGGKYNYDIAKNTIIPFLKSKGITKVDYLILTHGDYDHMGEAINLVNNFKVENVIFNDDNFNELENELIKVLDKKKINYYKGLKELNIGNDKLYFLNTKEYDNENDNSNVLYFKLNNYKFLFMGDAGTDREKDILEKYNLSDIDFIKIGHHGSNTSSSKYFIDSIKPKNCLISVGKNNRYGHPKESVIDTLDDYCDIYRTDINGSIEIKINKDNYKIKTYSP